MTTCSFKKCFAVGCEETIPRHLLMCSAHWRRVPGSIRTLVYDTWRAWETGGALRPYLLATWRAQLAVARTENRGQAAAAIAAIVAEIEKKENLPHAA